MDVKREEGKDAIGVIYKEKEYRVDQIQIHAAVSIEYRAPFGRAWQEEVNISKQVRTPPPSHIGHVR